MKVKGLYKYICLCGHVVWAEKDSLNIVCDNHYSSPTFPKYLKMKTMEMVDNLRIDR